MASDDWEDRYFSGENGQRTNAEDHFIFLDERIL